jgi:ABC-type transport system substrate-binding protein
VLQEQLATLENGLSVNNEVEVKAGDTVYDITGQVVTLEKGVKVFDKDGNEVEFDGETPITMLQLVTTHKLKPYTWNDGTPVSVADIELGYKFDCDPESGSTSFEICDQIADAQFGPGLEVTFTRVPGAQYPLYFIYPFALYPSHQVLADGRALKDVPAAEWVTLPEIVQTPLSYGPYYVKEWNKGQNLTLEQNPYYEGEVATPNVIFVFIADTNQAMAQLLAGDVDFLESSTLGAAYEALLPGVEAGDIELSVTASPTWEHVDINMFTK